jgi:hypothetical protein
MAAPAPINSHSAQFERLIITLPMCWGFPIFPCNPLTKAPIIGGHGGFKSATSDINQLRQWADLYPNAMAGLPTGHQTGFWVLDVDNKKDRDGFTSLAELERQHGKLPETFRVRTGTGGHHVYFKMPTGVRIPQRAGDIAPGLDVRGSTGYVIAPGSVLSDGREYVPLAGDFDNIVPAPQWLLFLAMFGKRRREDLGKIGIRGPDHLGCEPWQWVDRSRQLLRLERPKLQGTLTERGANEIRRYIKAGIAAEIEAIRGLEVGSRDTGINNDALKIWSLLNGAEELGVDVNDIAEKAGADFDESVSALGDEFSSPDYIEDKWSRARADADPRDLGHIPRGEAEDEFGDLLVKPDGGQLEYADDIDRHEIAQMGANALVQGLILPGEESVLYGESGAGKSFLSIDLGWHIALGREWHGRRVTQAPVLYVCLEGVGGFRKRMLAYRDRYGSPGKWFARLNIPVTLDASEAGAEGVRKIVEMMKWMQADLGQASGFILIDTLARAIPGADENAAKEISAYLEKRTGIIRRATGAHVLSVHHENKMGNMRGSTALKAGVDVQLHASGGVLDGEKTKDMADGPIFKYSLEPVEVCTNHLGEIETSCIVRTNPATASRRQKPAKQPPKTHKALLSAWRDVEGAGLASEGVLPGTGEIGRWCPVAAIRDAFVARYSTGDADGNAARESRERAWRRLSGALPSGFSILVDGDGNNIFWSVDDPLAGIE